MESGLILKHTEKIAAELKQRFEGDPKGELDCWVSTAHQREAMVVQIYNALKLDARVPDQQGPAADTVALVRETIGSVWAQETSHTTLMESLRKLDNEARWMKEGPQGSIEGLMTAWATSEGLLGTIARLNIKVARVFKAAPEFTAGLKAVPLRGFFALSEELEHTACNGYARIIELLEILDEKGEKSGYGVVPQYEFATTLAEENFHRAVFSEMDSWLKNERELDALDVGQALGAIKTLAVQHLSVKNVRRVGGGTPASTKQFLESEGDAFVSLGGLDGVFERFGGNFRVATPPAEERAAS